MLEWLKIYSVLMVDEFKQNIISAVHQILDAEYTAETHDKLKTLSRELQACQMLIDDLKMQCDKQRELIADDLAGVQDSQTIHYTSHGMLMYPSRDTKLPVYQTNMTPAGLPLTTRTAANLQDIPPALYYYAGGTPATPSRAGAPSNPSGAGETSRICHPLRGMHDGQADGQTGNQQATQDRSACPGWYMRIGPAIVQVPWPRIYHNTPYPPCSRCHHVTRAACEQHRREASAKYKTPQKKCYYAHQGDQLPRIIHQSRCPAQPNYGASASGNPASLDIQSIKALLLHGVHDIASAALAIETKKSPIVICGLDRVQ